MVFVYATPLMPYCKVTFSLGQGSALGGKGKKNERSEPRGVVWAGERVAIFPILPRFFAFFPHCGAWSQAKWRVRGYINAMKRTARFGQVS